MKCSASIRPGLGFRLQRKSDVIYVLRRAGENENDGWVESIVPRGRLVGFSPIDSHFLTSSSASVHFSCFCSNRQLQFRSSRINLQ